MIWRRRPFHSCRFDTWKSAWCRDTWAACPSPGDSAYEIWVTSDYQRALYDLLTSAGREHGLRLFGGRALNCMRIEKSFGTWARDFRPIYGPFEAGLGRFVNFTKGEFIGRAAAAEEKAVRRRAAAALLQGGGEGCGCHRRRADLARRQTRRLGDFGMLRTPRRRIARARLRARGAGRGRSTDSRSKSSASDVRGGSIGRRGVRSQRCADARLVGYTAARRRHTRIIAARSAYAEQHRRSPLQRPHRT